MTVRDAEKLLADNGFTVKSQKGTHKKFEKDTLRFILTHGNKSDQIHPKQEKELKNLIYNNMQTDKTTESQHIIDTAKLPINMGFPKIMSGVTLNIKTGKYE